MGSSGSKKSKTKQKSFKVLQLVLLGHAGAGKTTLAERFCMACLPNAENLSEAERRRIVKAHGNELAVPTCEVNIDGEIVRIEIYTSHFQKARATARERKEKKASLFKRAHAVAVVYDMTQKDSWKSLVDNIEDLGKYVPPNLPSMLVGNKLDLAANRVVSSVEATDLAEKHGMQSIETSGKDGSNAEEVFFHLARAILHTPNLNIPTTNYPLQDQLAEIRLSMGSSESSSIEYSSEEVFED